MKDISDPGSSGRIASIGKFLWDNRDIEKIRNLAWGDPPFAGWHTLTAEADMELKLTLKPLDSRKQILGSVIIGRDNLVITHTLPEATEAELVAVFSLACDLNVQITLKKLGTHRINQTVMKTNEWYLLTCRFDSGLLVSLCEMITIKELSRLIRKQQTTAIEIERILRKLFE